MKNSIPTNGFGPVVNKLLVSLASLVSMVYGSIACAGDTGSSRPNFVLIYADDLGYADLSCYGNEYHETPNIDRLMKEGIRFTQAYADAPLCTPSRFALLTGRHCARAGCYDVLPGRIVFGVKRDAVDFDPPTNNFNLPKDQRILPEFLKDIGYRTGAFGKWHVGRVQPNKRGFDEFVCLNTTSHLDSRKSFIGRSPNYPEPEGYSSDYLANCAVQFINQNKDEPFFLYLPHTLVHTVKSDGKGTLEPKPDLLHKYEAKAKSELHGNAAYAAMVEALDQAVGRTVEALRNRGILANTFVIFASDNGAALGSRRVTKSGVTVGQNTSNYPLREGKLQLYEGGIRIPTSISYGNIIREDAVSDAVISQLDLLPTILELAEHPQASEIMESLDGESLVPLLSDAHSNWPLRDLFWHFPGYRIRDFRTMAGQRPESAMRRGNWKLIESLETGDVQLYDLATDIGESNDVSAAHPEVVANLRKRLQSWRDETDAPMPERKRTDQR